ncbi:hypothetical protein V6N13_032718 [Hibiscus sabdariffa]
MSITISFNMFITLAKSPVISTSDHLRSSASSIASKHAKASTTETLFASVMYLQEPATTIPWLSLATTPTPTARAIGSIKVDFDDVTFLLLPMCTRCRVRYYTSRLIKCTKKLLLQLSSIEDH